MKKHIHVTRRWKKATAILLALAILLTSVPMPQKTAKAADSGKNSMTYQGAGFTLAFQKTAAWSGHINGEITLTNTGKKDIEDWCLYFSWQPQIQSMWCADYERTETGEYKITGMEYNKTLEQGKSVTFGFQAEGEDFTLPESYVLTEKKSESGKEDVTDEAEDMPLPIEKEELKGFGYALFSGSEKEDLRLAANSMTVRGNAHTNRNFYYEGNTYTEKGSLFAAGNITLATSDSKEAKKATALHKQAEFVSMPAAAGQIKEYLTCDEGTKRYDKDIFFSEKDTIFAGNALAEGSFDIRSENIDGSGIMYAKNNISWHGNGIRTKEEQTIFLCAQEGNITLDGTNMELSGVLYAPKGKVTINVNNFTLKGRIIADSIEFHGTNIRILAGADDLKLVDFLFTHNKRENLPPVADFLTGTDYVREKDGLAKVEVEDLSYSPDGDAIADKEWVLYYDKNNDGIYAEDEIIDRKTGNETKVTWQLSGVGNYMVFLTVTEETVENAQGEWEALSGDTREKEMTESSFTIYNQKPEASLAMRKKQQADILFTYGGADKEIEAEYKEKAEEIEKKLVKSGVDVKADIKRSTYKKMRSNFDWQVYSHEGWEEKDTEPLHVSTEGSISFTGYQKGEGLKDFVYAEEGDGKRTYEFTINKSGKNAAMEGTGFLFGADAEESESFNEYNSHRYQVFPTGMSWEEARDFCKEKGGYLATITSEREYQYIKENYVPDMKSYLCWLGAYATTFSKNAPWVWLTGEDFRWTKWASGEPNNSSEWCLEMYTANGTWNDKESDPGMGGSYGKQNTSFLCEWDGGHMSGYVLLLTEEGMKLLYIDDVDVDNFRNGSWQYVQNAGRLLGIFPYNASEQTHNIAIVTEGENVTITDNGETITENFPTGKKMEGAGFGPLASYTCEKTNSRAKSSVSDIRITVEKGADLGQLIKEYGWRRGASHAVINLEQEVSYSLGADKKIAEVIKKLEENECGFYGIGSYEAMGQYRKVLAGVSGAGYVQPLAKKETSYVALENALQSLILSADTTVGQWLTTEDTVEYTGIYKDAENDPVYGQQWEYEYNPSIFANEEETKTKTIIREEPITIFTKTGAYTIRLKVQDDPTQGNDALAEYRLWSDEVLSEKLVTVHNRPEASVKANVNQGEKEDTCRITLITKGSDKDHEGEKKQGIAAENLAWKKVDEEEWKEGRIPEICEAGTVYLIRYQVTDKEGALSAPSVAVIDTSEYTIPAVEKDKEAPTVILKVSKTHVSIREEIEITAYAEDNLGVRDFGLYINGKKVADHGGTIKYSSTEEETVSIRAKAEDFNGNTAEESAQVIIVDNLDHVPPEAVIISPVNKAVTAFDLDITGSATDNSGSVSYQIYLIAEDGTRKAVIEGDKEIKDGILGHLETKDLKDGTYTLHLEVGDREGNLSHAYKTFILDRNYQPSEMEEPKEPENPEEAEDTVCPTAEFTNVLINKEGFIEIHGTAEDEEGLDYYTLTLKAEGEERQICNENTPVHKGILARIAKDSIGSGDYPLTLYVADKAGNASVCRTTLHYEKTEKPGQGSTGEGSSEAGKEELELDKGKTEEQPKEPDNEKEPEEPARTEEAGITLTLSQKTASSGATVQFLVKLSGGIQKDTLEVTVDNKPVTLENYIGSFTYEEYGTVTVRAEALDKKGKKITAEEQVQFYNRGDTNPPKAVISTPEEEQVLTKETDIIGTASDKEGLAYYTLSYLMEGEKEFTRFAMGEKTVEDGVLGTLDTTMLRNGIYTIRLLVKDKGGNTVFTDRKILVESNLKIGNLSLGFTDITDTMAGTTVQVNRLYDSRNKNQGDFGYGWTLAVQGISLAETNPLYTGYEMVESGSLFTRSYYLRETVCHDIMVNYGDGTSDRFRLKLSPDKKSLIPLTQTQVGFTCVTNPKVKLEIDGDAEAIVGDGQLMFMEDSLYSAMRYKLTSAEGVVYYITPDYGISKIEDTNGNVITVSKNGYHASNRKNISFMRDEKGRVTKACDVAGNITTYAYDAAGDLVSVTDPAGRIVSFTYDKKHNLMSITDPMGVAVARNEYDDDGRLIATIDADGNRMEYEHDVEGRTEVVTDRLGNKTVYVYDDHGNVLSTTDANGKTTKSTYDSYGNVLTKTDAAGNVTAYTYDASGNMTTVTDASGNTLKNTYNSNNQVTSMNALGDTEILIDYDEKGNLTATTDAEGNETEYSYDRQGNVTGITDELGKVMSAKYDKEGNVIESTDSAGNKVTYTYDESGNKTSQTTYSVTEQGTEERTTHYVYNAAGELVQTVDADGNSTSVERNDNGKMSAAIDSKGRRTEYEYDQRGNVTKIIYPDGTTEQFTYDAEDRNTKTVSRTGLVTTYVYDKVGNLLKQTDARGNTVTYTYDSNYNLLTTTSAAGAVTSYAYDALNRNTSITDAEGNVTSFAYDAFSLQTSVTDAKGNVTKYEYDGNGNRTKVIYPDGTDVESGYDERGRTIWQKDAKGRKTEYIYDGSDRLVSVKQPNGAATSYTYDQNGNLTAVEDANGNITKYEYDLEGRRTKIILADGSTSASKYDKQGMLTETVDYNQVKTAYQYDEQDRILKEQTGSEYTSYEYDAYGRLAGVKTKSSSISYTYNKYGELEQKTYENGEAVRYLYDKYGRTSEIQVLCKDKVQTSTKYEYDKMNRLTRVIGRNGEATVYTYDANGNRETATFANGVKLTYTYDDVNRLILQKSVDKNGTVIAQYAYTLGKNGERVKVKESGACGEVETTYDYDKANRLVKETIRTDAGKTVYEYRYDKVGNRIGKETDGVKTSYTYDSRNRLTTEKTGNRELAYHYDANGNLVKQSGGADIIYTYDVYNRLTVYQQGEKKESYTYDAEGVRRSKTTGADSIYFVSDTSGNLSQTLAETDGKGNLKAEYTRADILAAQVRDGKVSYYLYDGHGDVRALLSEAGKITDRYRYNAYGELIEKTGDTENHYLYIGEYYDGTSSLYYLRARYMNPSTGNFLTMDTYEGSIYDPDTLHKYLYANGNPVTYSDPSGNFFSAVGGLIATTMNTVMNNYQTLHIMGMISGITNSAITAFLGGDDVQISEAFIKGYMTGFGIGAVMYVAAAYEIMTIAEMCMLMAASNTVMSVVLAFVAASSGNTKAVLVYGTLSVLSFYTFCKLYNANCTVDIVGNKGSVRVEFDNSDPYSPKLNGEKVNAGTPYETGVDGENYVAEQLGMDHNTTKVPVNGRNRIPDFYDAEQRLVVEVKNVEKLSYTSQLRDYVQIAQERGTVLTLYVRKNTTFTGPLQDAID